MPSSKAARYLQQIIANTQAIFRYTEGMDAEAYQRLLDITAQADVYEGIRQGLDDVAHRHTCPAREVFDDIRQKHGIPH